jgi:hypothetical protein
VLGVALGGAEAPAEESEAPLAAPGTPAAATQPIVLDRLLKLPDAQRYGVERRGGLSRGEWLARFTELREALAAEQRGLAQAQVQLDETAQSASNWQMNPIPGMEASPDAPLDYQLRLKIRRHRSEIERLENRLAGVPEEWRS